MAARDSSASVDDRAIGLDGIGQGLGTIESRTSLGQKLNTTSIGDAVLPLNRVPSIAAMLAEFARGGPIGGFR
jgi:hypothetical protein